MSDKRWGLIMLAVFGGLVAESGAQTAPPNIVVILADDMGYSDAGCYGGEIQTPALDRLAENGLRFTQFYNSARCWPSRTALITGYYPQQTNTDPMNWPLYRQGLSSMPSFVRPLPAFLKPHGYRCYHSGKWHVKPGPDTVLGAGGFDESYRVADHDRYFSPHELFLQDQPLPAISRPGFYLTTEIANRALGFLQKHREQTPDQPFFLYLAFTAPHYPLQAPEKEIAKYRDRYTAGWDQIRAERYARIVSMGLVRGELPERETDFHNAWGWSTEKLKAVLGPGEKADNSFWENLTAEEKAFQAEKMAIHAAMIDWMDQQIGRVTAWLEQTGQLENTLILFASDNGASSEMMVRGDGHDRNASPGSAGSFLCLGPGWACTANTPFRYSKGYVHEGGIATPFIVSWPAGIKDRGALRHTEGHLIDMVPTLAALAGGIPDGVRPADAPPLPGKNLLPAFAADVNIPRDDLYFSHIGNAAISKDGWKAVRTKGRDWELYRKEDDRTETRNLAAQYPERVDSLARRWEELNESFLKQRQSKKQDPSVEAGSAELVFTGDRYEKLADVPAMTPSNGIIWKMGVKVARACKPNAILMGNRHTPKRKTTFFKVTPSKGIQLFADGVELFRIPVVLPRDVWTSIVIEKKGTRFLLYLDGEKVGEAQVFASAPAMPCYLGGDPRAPKEFARCSIRNAVVEIK